MSTLPRTDDVLPVVAYIISLKVLTGSICLIKKSLVEDFVAGNNAGQKVSLCGVVLLKAEESASLNCDPL